MPGYSPQPPRDRLDWMATYLLVVGVILGLALATLIALVISAVEVI